MSSFSVDEQLRVNPDQWIDPLVVEAWFGESRPLEIDLGCGKGRFLLARAAAHPEINFLGIERLLGRVEKVGKLGKRLSLDNLRLLRVEGYYGVRFLVPRNAVRTYYIFHPDPWPKKKHHRNRIMNPRFMDALCETLEPGGTVHFATDHLPYFYETVDQMEADERFEAITPFQPTEVERTDFELMFLGEKAIGRYSFVKS